MEKIKTHGVFLDQYKLTTKKMGKKIKSKHCKTEAGKKRNVITTVTCKSQIAN